MLSDSDRISIRRFVQDGLGCACPDRVFDVISAERDRGGVLLQLAIGGRLLIRVHEVVEGESLLGDLPQWIAAGARERDALALKRLRLVLAAENPEAVEAPARGIFDRASAGLGDVHLHVLGRSGLDLALGPELLPARRAR